MTPELAHGRVPAAGAEAGDALTVTLSECPALPVLEAQWRSLEAQSDASFFMSWTWIGNWLQRLEPHRRPRVLRAARGSRVVGLGLLVPGWTFRLRVLPSRCLHLHATGERRHDDIAVEHNGFLVSRHDAAQIEVAMLAFLCSRQHDWDQVRLPGLSVLPALAGVAASGTVVRQEVEHAYAVDLAAIRAQGGDYLGQLSRNTRSQVRRSLKAYEALGELAVTAAEGAGQAAQFLARLKTFHQRAWTARGAPGAFANPMFEDFHARLIAHGSPRGEVQLLRVHAGRHDIGYLYNFVHQGRVMSYQSGFNYELIEKNSRPGLAVHALAVQHYLEAGLDTYDFLAGAARYKQQLASCSYPMISLSMHRNTLSLRVQEAWQGLKARLRPTSALAVGLPTPLQQGQE